MNGNEGRSPMRLNIGCGDRPTEGWINYDNSMSIIIGKIPFLPGLLRMAGLISPEQLKFIRISRSGKIRYGDVVRRIPHSDSSVDLIYSCHMLEHLTRSDALRFLRECRRVLVPGGAIRIVVPDLRILIDNYMGGGDADQFVESLYVLPVEPDTLIGRLKCLLLGGRLHLWMYDACSLSELMVSAGFRCPTILAAGATTVDGLINIDLAERSEESLYIEAINS